MFHRRHRLRTLLFHRKVMFRSWDIQVFVLLTIQWLTKSVTSWWVSVWIYLLNHNSLTHQTWPIDRYKQGKYFFEIFWTIWRTGAKFQALFNLATCSNYWITSWFDTSCFRHRFANFGHTNLGMPKFNLK